MAAFSGFTNIAFVSSYLPFLIVSTQTIKSALNNSLALGVGQIKSTAQMLGGGNLFMLAIMLCLKK